MDLSLPALAHHCATTGRPFSAGQEVTSCLVRLPSGQYLRHDLALDAPLPADGEIVCRWRQVFKPRTPGDSQERNLRLSAENLFLALFEGGDDPDPASTPLKQFLALFLERKRILRPRGTSPDGAFRILEHTRLKRTFPVPAGDLDAAFFARIHSQLGPLLGPPQAPATPTLPPQTRPATAR